MSNKGCVCRICGKEISDNDYIQMYNNNEKISVCNICADNISQIRSCVTELEFDMLKSKNDTGTVHNNQLKPVEIKALLDQYIIGQEHAKKVLAVACYNHYKRCELQDKGIKKSNVLLIGPTGCGKTYLVETLAKILDVPLAMAAATTLTEAGYIGDDVESVIAKLLDAAGGDVKKAERGIVFIDEIDKLSGKSSDTEKKVGGKGVQQALLPLLEGTVVSVQKSGIDAGNLGFKVKVDTSGILFICAGAFPEMEQIIKARIYQKVKIGFTSNVEREAVDETNLLMKVTTDDLREFGLIPEFIGRLPSIVTLENMSKDMLMRILVEPKDSLISQYQRLLKYDNVDIVFEDDVLDLIAEKAMIKGTGARALRNILEDLLLDIMYFAPSVGVNEIRITKDFINSRNISYYYDQAVNRAVMC